MEELKKEKESILEKFNKIITGICAFLLVLVFTDIRNQISEIRNDIKVASTQYIDLKERIIILEYATGVKSTDKKTTSLILNRGQTPIKPFNLVFTKPEEYEYKGPNIKHPTG